MSVGRDRSLTSGGSEEDLIAGRCEEREFTMSRMIQEIDDRAWNVVADDGRYKVCDLAIGDATTMSRTLLRAGQETRGHTHSHVEVLFCESGSGSLLTGSEVDPQLTSIGPGVAVLIDSDEWHRVVATNEPVAFTCVFEGSRALSTYTQLSDPPDIAPVGRT